MKVFESLIARMERVDLAAFPQTATSALEDLRYDWTLDRFHASLAEHLLSGPLPEQIQVHNQFGQPPITLFNNGKWVLDLYLWTDYDTSTHSHGFRGAFRVLHGCSLHEKFQPRPQRDFAPDIKLTELGQPEREILGRGDVRTIQPDVQLTHRVIHLHNPTVTLCVKTINERSLNQWHYFSNGLAVQKRQVPADLVKKIYAFQYLRAKTSGAGPFLDGVLSGLDLSLLMNLCEEIAGGAYDLDDATAHFILDRVMKRCQDEPWFLLYEQAQVADLQAQDSAHGPGARLHQHLEFTKAPAAEVQRLAQVLAGILPQSSV